MIHLFKPQGLKSKGFSLIEVLIASALASTVFLGAGSLLTLSSKIISYTKENNVQNLIQYKLVQAIYSELGMKNNCENNVNLNRCFIKGPTSCRAVNNFEPLNLYDMNGEQISGTVTNPLYWSAEGIPCTAKSEKCNLRVESTYRVQGHPEKLPSCVVNCRSYFPTEFPPTDHLHEILIIQYSIRKEIDMSVPNMADTNNLAERAGTVVIGLDETYNKYPGCPNP